MTDRVLFGGGGGDDSDDDSDEDEDDDDNVDDNSDYEYEDEDEDSDYDYDDYDDEMVYIDPDLFFDLEVPGVLGHLHRLQSLLWAAAALEDEMRLFSLVESMQCGPLVVHCALTDSSANFSSNIRQSIVMYQNPSTLVQLSSIACADSPFETILFIYVLCRGSHVLVMFGCDDGYTFYATIYVFSMFDMPSLRVAFAGVRSIEFASMRDFEATIRSAYRFDTSQELVSPSRRSTLPNGVVRPGHLLTYYTPLLCQGGSEAQSFRRHSRWGICKTVYLPYSARTHSTLSPYLHSRHPIMIYRQTME